MGLEPAEHVIFEGHPSWRSILGFYLNFTGVASPHEVVEAVHRAQRDSDAVAVPR